MRKVLRLIQWFFRECYVAFQKLLTEIVRLFPTWVTANHLTISRLYVGAFSTGTLVFFIVDHTPWLMSVNFALLAIAAVLDLLDGPLARLRGTVTKEGSILDAGADKLITLFNLCFVAAVVRPLLVWFFAFVALETVHATAGLLTNRRLAVGARLESNWPGKIKMWTVCGAIITGLLALANEGAERVRFTGLTRALLIVSILLAVYSMLLHAARHRRLELAVVKAQSETPASSA